MSLNRDTRHGEHIGATCLHVINSSIHKAEDPLICPKFKLHRPREFQPDFPSQSPVKETTLSQTISGTKTLVTTVPYAAAFSKNKDMDTLLVPYTLPSVASGTVIRLDYQITNVNTLNIVRTVYVKVK